VVVEVPPEEEDSDVITLRGMPKNLADAIALVYSKASSVVNAEIRFAEWMRRYLIGPKGSKLHVRLFDYCLPSKSLRQKESLLTILSFIFTVVDSD
jgi:hypothetical protein